MCIKNWFKKKEEVKKNWIYYGVFFSEKTGKAILKYVKDWFNKNGKEFPEDWKIYCEHMTLVFNDGSESAQKFADFVEPFLGQSASMRVLSIGVSDRAIAIGVDYKTNNEHSHVTVAVTPDGGKPVESNYITDWTPVEKAFYLSGTIKKVS